MDNKDNIEVLSEARIEELWGRSCRPEFESDYLSFARNVESEAIAALASQSQAAQPTGDLAEVHLLHSEEQDILLMANYHATGEDDGNYSFESGGLLHLIRRAIAQYAHIAGTSQATKAQAEPEGWRDTLEAARSYITAAGEESGYGFARPANPHHFHPDAESCDPDEIAAHKAACEAYDKGEYTPERGSEWVGSMHILRAPWGIGSYTMTDPAAANLVASIDKLRAAPVAKEAPAVLEAVTRESALTAIGHVDAHNAPGRKREAVCMLVPVASVAKAETPTAWLATDLDGRGDVGFTKEEAKRRAGEGCTEFFPLYDLPHVAPVAKAETGSVQARGDELFATVLDGVDTRATAKLGEVDTERMDWLDQNIFHREMDEWDTRTRRDQWMWVIFAPKGVQGSAFPARKIIDAAMGYEQDSSSVVATTTSTVSAPTSVTGIELEDSCGDTDL